MQKVPLKKQITRKIKASSSTEKYRTSKIGINRLSPKLQSVKLRQTWVKYSIARLKLSRTKLTQSHNLRRRRTKGVAHFWSCLLLKAL